MIWARIADASRETKHLIAQRSEKFCVRHNIDICGKGPELAIQQHCELLRSSGLPWAVQQGKYIWSLWVDMVERCLKK